MLQLARLEPERPHKAALRYTGRIVSTRGSLIQARLPAAALGEMCMIEAGRGKMLAGMIVGFNDDLFSIAPLGDLAGLSPGAVVATTGRAPQLAISGSMRGRILDALGAPLDGQPLPTDTEKRPLNAPPPGALERRPIDTALSTAVRSIDSLLTLGRGQRIGLFAPAGLGKSTLLGMIARNSAADVVVACFVGERGREVNEFITDNLGRAGLNRSVLVVSTSDEIPIRRMLAPYSATAIAEYFRDQGQNVLLLVDSLTRTARAIRDVSLEAGELPVRHGYTPKVYAELPRLLERAGTARRGSITAVYSILSGENGETDPLSEEVRSILDGHLMLSRERWELGCRPPIDPLRSVSRLFRRLSPKDYVRDAETVLKIAARLRRDRDIIMLGGAPDDELQRMLQLEPELEAALTQQADEAVDSAEARARISDIAARFRASSS